MSIAATTLVLGSHTFVSASPLNKLVRHTVVFVAHLALWNGLETFSFDCRFHVWWERGLAGRPVPQDSFTHSTPVHFYRIGDVLVVPTTVLSRVLVDCVLQQNQLMIGY